MHCLETIDEEKTKESSYSNTIAEKSPAVSTEDPPVIHTLPGEDHWVRTLRVQSGSTQISHGPGVNLLPGTLGGKARKHAVSLEAPRKKTSEAISITTLKEYFNQNSSI